MRSLVRRDTGKDYETFVKGLATSSGVPTPTRKELVQFDRKRKKKTSNREWVNPHDPEAKITKLKDGRTRLGHKVEEAVDLETGAVVAVRAPEELGDTQTMGDTLRMAREEVEAVGSGSPGPGSGDGPGIPQQRDGSGIEGTGIAGVSVGTGSGPTQLEGEEPEVPGAGLRESQTDPGAAGATVAAAAQRIGGAAVRAPVHHGRLAPALRPGPRQRAQAMLIHVCGFNLGLLMRHLMGFGTPRSLQGRVLARHFSLFGAKKGRWIGWNRLWKRFWASIRADLRFWASRTHQ